MEKFCRAVRSSERLFDYTLRREDGPRKSPECYTQSRRLPAISTDSELPAATIAGVRTDYRFTSPATVDIVFRLTVDVQNSSVPLVAGASVYASGDNTPAEFLPAQAGRYIVPLPVRGQVVVPWQPYRASSEGTPKRYLVNFKVTQVPESEDDSPEVVAHLGATVGFRTIELLPDAPADTVTGLPTRLRVNGTEIEVRSQELASDALADIPGLRAALMALRESGVNLISVRASSTDVPLDLYRLCTELGLLVCRELPVEASAIEIVLGARGFPSLALWRLSAGGDDAARESLANQIREEAPNSPLLPMA